MTIADEDRTASNLPQAAEKALRPFFRLAQSWALTDSEAAKLLGVDEVAVQSWRRGNATPAVSDETALRMGYLFRIWAALQPLLSSPERCKEWLRLPNANPVFGGKPALDLMLEGTTHNLQAVAEYLDAQNSGDFS